MRGQPIKIGDRFGKLIVLGRPFHVCVGTLLKRHRHVVCRCDCGTVGVWQAGKLLIGHTKSCGCYRRETVNTYRRTHGGKRTRLYTIWVNMRRRCDSPVVKCWDRYGGRGISVCKEWGRFEPFRDWAFATGYNDDLVIDRIDPDGNYEPSNCQWISGAENSKKVASDRRKHIAQLQEEIALLRLQVATLEKQVQQPMSQPATI